MRHFAGLFSRGRLGTGVIAASLIASAAWVAAPAALAAPAVYSISGTVSMESGEALPADVEVLLQSNFSGPPVGDRSSEPLAHGEFRFLNAPPGSYTLVASGDSVWESVQVEVTDADVIKNISAESRGRVSGLVNVEGHVEDLYVDVTAYDIGGRAVGTSYARVNSGDPYAFPPIPVGTYKVGFSKSSTGSSNQTIANQFYDQVPELAAARTVIVTAGGTTPGVNADWNADGSIAGYVPPVEFGVVEGTVRTDLPKHGLEVLVEFEPVGGGHTEGRFAFLDEGKPWDGKYSAAVPPGTYKVGFSKSPSLTSSVDFARTYYGGPTAETAKTITVVANETITNIDATLTGPSVPTDPNDPTIPTPTDPTNPTTPTPKPTTPATPSNPSTGAGEPSGSVTSGVSAAGTVTPGEAIAVAATGLPASTTVEVYLHSDPIWLGTLTTNASGGLSGSVTLPATAPAGNHSIVLHYDLNGEPRQTSIAAVTITPEAAAAAVAKAKAMAAADAKALASTGTNTLSSFVLIGVLVAAGFSVTLVARRKRATASV